MKRILSTVLSVTLLALMIPGLSGCRRIPKDWYKESIAYYSEGVKTNWANEDKSLRLNISAELKNNSLQRGYLLRDLDGDGIDELLIGFNDTATYTKFTDVIVWHSDLGASQLLGGTNGKYIGLCASNVLSVNTYGSIKDQVEYMKWNHKSNAFDVIDGEGKYLPMKWELTPFE